MGQMKHLMEENEGKFNIGIKIAVRAKAISECEFHQGTYLYNLDDDANKYAYIIGNKLFSDGDELVSTFKSRKELSDSIKDAIEYAGEECPTCRKWQDD